MNLPNIWQEVFKGKILNEEYITSLSTNEMKVAHFFSSKESSNYIKYLEATGKGGVGHDYLKYDSSMYQDMLTSLAIRDDRLSDQVLSTSNNNAADIETIESKTRLIDEAQNLYEKKALEYGGIAGTHAVYRDYLEQISKNFGDSHKKVALYKNIVRDVSMLHSAQLGININDLPDSYHKEIANAIYNNVTSYKVSNGRGRSEHNIDDQDKIKIAEHCYQQLCGGGMWRDKAHMNLSKALAILERRASFKRELESASVAIALEYKKFASHQAEIKHKILGSTTISDVFVALEKDQQFFVASNGNINPNFDDFQELAQYAIKQKEQQLLPRLKDVVASVEQHGVFSPQEILAELKDSK
ncbi:MAG TPA: toprim domain protein, partial [Rickettsia endosymbiont of Bembidion nr. Transversale]|nr:toprim domain protein [Rickettsia endosymbiont of Bembidion nr. Transversale]